MLTPEEVKDYMRNYSLTQSVIALAAGISDPDLSSWLRGRKELPPHVLSAIDHGLHALADIAHDSIPWPVDFSSPKMVPLLAKYLAKHEAYLREKAREPFSLK